MKTTNLDPFWRTSIGFDRLFDLMDESLRFEPEDHYPPCNIVRTGENNVSHLARGCRIQARTSQCDPSPKHADRVRNCRREAEEDKGEYLYRGIAGRSFERRFNLADYVVVKSASLDDGLLQIELEREIPEAMKPRRIEIQTGKPLARAIRSAPSSIPKSHKNDFRHINGLRCTSWSGFLLALHFGGSSLIHPLKLLVRLASAEAHYHSGSTRA